MNNINQHITDYYKEMDLNPIFIDSVFQIFKLLSHKRKKTVIVSDNRLVHIAARMLRMNRVKKSTSSESVVQYFAMNDAFLLLAKKGIPVFYYNRIGKEKDGFVYSETAQNRMNKGLSFPVMYEKIDSYSADLKELFGDLYDKDYIEQIGKIPQVIQKGNVYRHEDYSSKYVNVVNGERIVLYQPQKYSKILHLYGRCGVFGYAVEDKDTLPSKLQLYFYEHGIQDIKVVNHGLWGGTDEYIDHNFLIDSIGFKEGDIILFYKMHIDKRLLKKWEDLGVQYKEITHEWHQCPEAKWCFYDKPGHMNNIGYQNVANIIGEDLIKNGFKCKPVDEAHFKSFKSDKLNDYIKNSRNSDFFKEIKVYIDDIIKQYPLDNTSTCGAIVMNCNPFTNGHRYLVEYAKRKVDRLYIFVLKEDKSFFKYEDRFLMVKNGTKDLESVVVVSSGKFMISALTFPEYFMKDYVKEKDFDVSSDVEIFCEYIAPPLNIKIRFAGEEPFDPVTKNYNENMSKILPKYGMEFCEIPRLTTDAGEVVNATEVRKLLKERNFGKISKYVPQTTLDILKEKY